MFDAYEHDPGERAAIVPDKPGGATRAARGTVLVVDDERAFRVMAEEALEREGFKVQSAPSLAAARAALERGAPDVVLLDRRLPDGDGIDLLRALREADAPGTLVIIVSAHGGVEDAVEALRAGAADYLVKPLGVADLLVKLDRSLQTRSLRRQLARARDRAAPAPRAGAGSVERALGDALSGVARSPTTPVLLLGASGTGKQRAAEWLHDMTYPGSDAPFVDVNCAALPARMVESELFGHEKGAFSGAQTVRRGMAELADGGTLFLDEVTELPESSQSKLLKFLDTLRFRRVGGERDIEVRLRVAAATNKNITELVRTGSFRADLYHRLAVFTISVPPLVARREDIAALADGFVRHYATRLNKRITGLSPGALARLLEYDYPGNVRELRNIIERAVILASESEIDARDIVLPGAPPLAPQPGPRAFFAVDLDPARAPPTAADVEKAYVRRVLEHFGGRRMLAAQALGLSYPTFLRRIRKLRAG